MSNSNIEYTYEDLYSCLEQSKTYGFLSPQPIERQITHSVDFLSLLPEGTKKALDLGSGGGLPSLVWLHVDQEVEIVALDSMRKRTDFLTEIKLKNKPITNRLTVVNGRAESLSHKVEYREVFEVVVARGFGSPAVTAECGSGFLKPGGYLYVSGRPENETSRWDTDKLTSLNLELETVLEKNESHVAKLYKSGKLDSAFPRPSKDIKKNPLW